MAGFPTALGTSNLCTSRADTIGVLIELRKDDSRPVYQQIADEVSGDRGACGAQVGEPLPATRQLAADCKLNPRTPSSTPTGRCCRRA